MNYVFKKSGVFFKFIHCTWNNFTLEITILSNEWMNERMNDNFTLEITILSNEWIEGLGRYSSFGDGTSNHSPCCAHVVA